MGDLAVNDEEDGHTAVATAGLDKDIWVTSVAINNQTNKLYTAHTSTTTIIIAMMAAIREVTLVVVATTEQESSCTSRKQEYPPHTTLSVVLEPMESSGVYSSFGSSEAKTSENGHQLRMIHEEKNLSDGGLSSSRSSSLSGKSLRQQQQQLHVNFDDQ